jgi:hypothetical protein
VQFVRLPTVICRLSRVRALQAKLSVDVSVLHAFRVDV